MNALYVVWPSSSGLVGKGAAGNRSESRSEHRLFCGIQKRRVHNPGTGKENTHFEIRMRIFIHNQWADTFHVTRWNTGMAMIFTCGTSVTSMREREIHPPLHPAQLLLPLASVGSTQLRGGGAEEESGANMCLMMTHETALFAGPASRSEYQPTVAHKAR